MNEVKTTLKNMSVYYLLMAINIIPCASVIPDIFPNRNISTIYLLLLAVCLVLYYSQRVSSAGALSATMKSLAWMGLLMILLRGIKYSAFAEVGVLARHTWYLYYVPMLLQPLFLFYISLLVSPKDAAHLPRGWYLTLAVTVLFIVLVITNDLHQLVFRFQPHFENWDNEYTHGWLFYAVTGWQYALYLAAIIILVFKCRISSAKRNAWIILIPVSIGILLSILLMTDKMPQINGDNIVEFPEMVIFTVAAVLECCICLGLIPSNTDYGKLFQKFSIAAQITDEKGTPVYASHAAIPLTAEQFAATGPSRIGAHTLLHKMKIPGGFGFWLADMTELDRLNEELAEAKEELAQEAELIRLRNDLKERQITVEERTRVYDTIARRTQRQSQAISQLAESARLSDDIAVREACRGKITLLGAYIKRYANLMLLSQESGVIEAGELGLSVSEVLRYLQFCGIPCESICSAECTLPADAALAVFEAFELLLESNIATLCGTFVNLSEQPDGVTFKLTLENPTETLPKHALTQLDAAGVSCDMKQEDDVMYVCFTHKEGGGAV